MSVPSKKFTVTAIVVPRVTCDLQLQPIPFDLKWNHLLDIQLADPSFMQPGRFDILLVVDMFIEVVLHGWQVGPPGSPIAFETEFCWSLLARLMSTHLLISLQHKGRTHNRIPRLELCDTHLLAQLLHHVKEVFHLSLHEVYVWTDSTIVLS